MRGEGDGGGCRKNAIHLLIPPDNLLRPLPAPRDPQRPLSCAIAYDTRHRSRQFAELCAEIMAAAGFTVFFLDGYRSTPELSFAVRYKQCDCGIIITASHNPPSDNAVKAYGPSGGQYIPPARHRFGRQ